MSGAPGGATPYARRRRRPRGLVLFFVALLVVPTLEIAVIVAVARVIGGWPTLLLLLLESVLGAWIVGREGARAWAALVEALRTGRMPSRELADAALVLVGGTLLLTPGFLTDLVGFFVILPLTRPVARRLLEAAVARRILWASTTGSAGPGGRAGGDGGSGRADGPPEVIEGEIVD